MTNHKRPSDHLGHSHHHKSVPNTASHTVCTCLNTLLANEYSLFTKTLNYHWNITGPRFHSLHRFLEGHYRELLEIMDGVAERVRVLDERPIGTIKQMYNETEVKDSVGETLLAEDMLKNLLRDHELIKGQIKEVVSDDDLFKQDPGSQDFMIGILQKHEMMAWMLKSHIV